MKVVKNGILLAALFCVAFGLTRVSADLELTLDGVDPNLQCQEVWYENCVALSVIPAGEGECGTGSCYFGVHEGNLWLYPATLSVDLGEIQGAITVVRIDIIDGCPGVGCDYAFLWDHGTVVSMDQDPADEYFMLDGTGYNVDSLTVNSCESAVLHITFFGDVSAPPSSTDGSTWGAVKALYR
jgi:hypothetical protein